MKESWCFSHTMLSATKEEQNSHVYSTIMQIEYKAQFSKEGLSLKEAERVFSQGINLLDEKADSLKMYFLCERCEDQREEFGIHKSSTGGELFFIV